MKRAIAIVLLAISIAAAAVGCSNPKPLPVAPTPIPTLIPATAPASGATSSVAVTSIKYPSQMPDAQAGQAVYSANCASCHGADGKGTVDKARDFTDADYLRGAAPADFFGTITAGKDQMPAFGDSLSDQARWNVTFYLWSFSVTSAELAQGQTTFDANCVACHGSDGSGAIPQAPKFTNVEFIASQPATTFFNAVTSGKGIMPAWQSRLSADERWAAVEYARSFAYKPVGN